MNKKTFILLFQCADQRGIVARISDFIFNHGGNIITADQYSTDPENGAFFLRIEFLLDYDHCNRTDLNKEFLPILASFNSQWHLYDKHERLRMGIFVSKPDHCLHELLYLWKSGELRVSIPFVAGNCDAHRELVESHKIPFHFIPATPTDRRESEFLALAQAESDFLVLARYMMVLSHDFLRQYGKDIINIHHGFLPSFKGAHPYRQAFDQGVKVIGATAHFVNEKLDEGPIITQLVEYVSHKDSVDSLVRKGKKLEQHALAKAIDAYVDHRVLRFQNKTIVFEG
jgi:formyltetrahydrofolate deformylase